MCDDGTQWGVGNCDVFKVNSIVPFLALTHETRGDNGTFMVFSVVHLLSPPAVCSSAWYLSFAEQPLLRYGLPFFVIIFMEVYLHEWLKFAANEVLPLFTL